MKTPKTDELPQIAEIIIVEGRDDTAAIRRAVRAVTIETHGFGISKNTWEKIESAYKTNGIIVFTDPDHAGEEIRRRIIEKFPDAKQAFLSREKASEKKAQRTDSKDGAHDSAHDGSQVAQTLIDIGIENASPEDIREALEKARSQILESACAETFTMKDLDDAGLTGGDGAKAAREKLGDILGIGYANAKGLLYKLNTLGIDRAAFEDAIKKL